MKKILYFFVLVLLPAIGFSQFNQNNYSTSQRDSAVKIYPNPNKGAFTILFPKEYNITTTVMIFDNTSKQVFARDRLNANTLRVDLGQCQPGIYFAVFNEGNKRTVEKIVVTR